jgi:hypothetical protein
MTVALTFSYFWGRQRLKLLLDSHPRGWRLRNYGIESCYQAMTDEDVTDREDLVHTAVNSRERERARERERESVRACVR